MLQQNLTNITMSRETDLDHARSYYELLYKTAEVSNNSFQSKRNFKLAVSSVCSSSHVCVCAFTMAFKARKSVSFPHSK